MKAQEIFDTVAKHLATQGRKAMIANACAYRGEGGLKCAAGVLIRDDEYNDGMEGKMADDILPRRLCPHVDLILRLQYAHDDSQTGAAVSAKLYEAAIMHRLSPAILDTLKFPDVWE
jgi:hypothetical protein